MMLHRHFEEKKPAKVTKAKEKSEEAPKRKTTAKKTAE